MSIPELDQRCAKLRQRLKEWEASFTAAHDGRKPSRDDVKQDVKITTRYKEYNTIRERLSKRHIASTPSQRKRSSSGLGETQDPYETPSKRQKQLPSSHPAAVDPYDPPISFLLSPSQHRACIGPTPQKDGKVLGMFDAFSTTPASRTQPNRRSLRDASNNIHATPTKNLALQKASQEDDPIMKDKLDIQVTPSIQRIIKSSTPSSRGSMRKLRFDNTPAFLRRDSQAVAASVQGHNEGEQSASWSPVATRQIRRPLGRTLSAIVKDLRDMEDEKLDEDLELMREMEGEIFPTAMHKPTIKPSVQVEDSQQVEMPLGPDQGPLTDDGLGAEVEGRQGDGQRHKKAWKKKGQKRTTRKVDIRPNTAKWKPEPKWKDQESDEDDTLHKSRERGEGDQDGDGDVETTTDPEIKNDSDGAKAKEKMSQHDKASKLGRLAKAKRKISATANANFRALKIKNKNSKGNGRGRFGRRR